MTTLDLGFRGSAAARFPFATGGLGDARDLDSVRADLCQLPTLTRWTAERIPRCEVAVIAGAAHLPHVTAPASVSRSIAPFLTSVGGDA